MTSWPDDPREAEDHVNHCSTGLTPYKCPSCPHTYTGADQSGFYLRNAHVLRKHCKHVLDYACPVCPFRFESKPRLKEHMQKHAIYSKNQKNQRAARRIKALTSQSKEESIVCEKCGETFPNNKVLSGHNLVCLGPGQIIVRGKVYPRDSESEISRKYRNNKISFQRCYARIERLKTEGSTSENYDSSKGVWCCVYCENEPTTFAYLPSLQKHQFTAHTGQVRFVCEPCSFKSLSGMSSLTIVSSYSWQ